MVLWAPQRVLTKRWSSRARKGGILWSMVPRSGHFRVGVDVRGWLFKGLGWGDSCGKTNVAASWKEQMSLVLGWTKKPEDRGQLHRADLSRLLPFSEHNSETDWVALPQPTFCSC